MFDILIIIFGLFISQASAQNITCPTRPSTDNSNACANTAFVQGLVANPGAWATYTPTVTCGSGTITSSTNFGRYKQLTTKTYAIQINVNITTNGTCSVYVGATLPNGLEAASFYLLNGREMAVVGKVLSGIALGNTNLIAMVNYDNTYPGGNGYNLVVSGILEVQ